MQSLLQFVILLALAVPWPWPTATAGKEGKGPTFAANKFCLRNGRRNYLDIYADPDDCHRYFQCYYLSDSQAFGYHRQCPRKQYWNPKFLQCMPEGSLPCSDQCSTLDRDGCYAGTGCRHYFKCENFISQPNCCPPMTRFTPNECGCEAAPYCGDSCAVRGIKNLTFQDSNLIDENLCKDKYGNIIAGVENDDTAFRVMAKSGKPTAMQRCPPTLEFDLLMCQCAKMNRESKMHRKALIWMPFDNDVLDHSINPKEVTAVPPAQRDSKTSAVTGGGSLVVQNGGHLTISSLKTDDFHHKFSFCLFFRCQATTASNLRYCVQNGGLFSNDNPAVSDFFSIALGVRRFNHFTARLEFLKPIGKKEVSAALRTSPTGWNHACITYDANALRLYLNGELMDAQLVGSTLLMSNQLFLVGTDPALGHFNGHIDDIIVTDFDMTAGEIKAHFTGNHTYLARRGFFLDGSNSN